jgi:hypothetical protein
MRRSRRTPPHLPAPRPCPASKAAPPSRTYRAESACATAEPGGTPHCADRNEISWLRLAQIYFVASQPERSIAPSSPRWNKVTSLVEGYVDHVRDNYAHLVDDRHVTY